MINFSRVPVLRREFSDEPGDTPFYIIYSDDVDIGEAYRDENDGSVDAYVAISASHLASEIQAAIRRVFHTDYIEVTYVD